MNKTIMHIVPAFRVGGAEVMVENLLIELKRQNYNATNIKDSKKTYYELNQKLYILICIFLNMFMLQA